MNHRKSVLSAAILACLGVSAQAQAQQAPAQQPVAEAAELDRVVVTGIRGSLQQALDTKRNADAFVDAITAEDVGKFPSTNVAEAMTVIPGVTIDRLFGQGEKVSILGTDPALNRTLLNGQTVASADWFIVDQPGRTFNYALLAPEIVGKVEVYKSPEARIDEGSIGGTVIVTTRRPLDLDANTFAGSIGYLYNDRSEEADPQGSLMYSWKNPAGTFGVAVSFQTSTENLRRDGVESYGSVSARDYRDGQGGGGSVNNLPPDWSQAPNPDGSQPTLPASCTGTCAETLENNLDARGPNSLSASFFEQERKRNSFTLSLQARPVDRLDLEFNALRVDASYDNLNQSMFAFMGNAWNGLMKMTDVTIEDGIITRGTFANALSVLDVQNRLAEIDTESYDFKAGWDDERWFASAHVGTTKATGGTSQQVFGEFLNWADYSYDISGAPGRPGSVSYPGSNPFSDPSAFRFDGGWGTDPDDPAAWNPGWGGNVVFKPTSDRERYGQLDFGVRLDSPVYLLRFGAKRREHETEQLMGGVSLASVAGYGDAPASLFDPRQVPDNYLDGFDGVTDEMENRFYIDGWALADYILGGDWLAPWQSMPVPSTFNDPSFAANTFKITEDVDAAYVQADFSFARVRGNVGLRYVRTESESAGWACVATDVPPPCPADGYAPVSVNKQYNNVLPNLNLVYEATDDLLLRFSAASVIARPNYADMSSYLWLGDQTLTGGGGNPDLEPYEANNFDASAEWYFAENSILSGTVYYKDIDNYILTTTRPETHFNQAQGEETVYQVSRPDNAGTAKIQGVAIAFQQSFDNGLGVLANYTYSDGESSTGEPMPYNSENQVNLSPFFEAGAWSARVTYSWRSKYFTNVDRGDELWVRPYESVDASLGYRFNDNYSLTLNAMNLLDEAYHSYATDERLTRGVYRSGRRYTAMLRVNF
ncbi:TonB-dependent receptor [Luteimonas sp. RD2P54]|uniref:TonB-dependent receptor n=1 Tax=Luteimonas endophytica TaxID=3042023 RepID=A0ABT6JCT2_9GAMM|nr:TonB-dependent receptor [Luteimonas endophytica]MDH5824586.1 TonB-dependent receptor [Luteimonas endophytica]